ncbi:MAG: class I SAM-dependent methyltransferase [Clostridia bacterium]|nr:class I SAM-dependent methyltransferase [Clostridia bacterium]
MGLFKKAINQVRKPSGPLGGLMLMSMTLGHARLSAWGRTHIAPPEPREIVDLGCGGGRNTAALLKQYPSARVTAVDYAPLCVEKAARHNRAAIAQGRCTVLEGDVSHLALEAGKYDLATAFETIYFWPNLEKCFAEVARVLQPKGRLIIVNESDGTDATGRRFENMIDGMKCYTAEEIEAALRMAGFSSIQADHYKGKPWMTIVAAK